MSIFTRMSDIINSNINALLDKAEDPEKMVRLIIQEMEEALVEVRSTSARAIADKKELARRQEYLASEAAEWERKAEVAVNRGRDDLAKGALIERNRAQEASDAVSAELELIAESLARMNEDVGALQAKIKDAKARRNLIVRRGKTVSTRLGVKRQLNAHNIDDAMQRFESYERKIDDLEAQVEAYDMGQRTLSDEIEDLETDVEIDEQLASLKARLSGASASKPAAGTAASDQSSNA
ncbi:MAG: phage shock protein PspA [Pseudomonadales bacterium]